MNRKGHAPHKHASTSDASGRIDDPRSRARGQPAQLSGDDALPGMDGTAARDTGPRVTGPTEAQHEQYIVKPVQKALQVLIALGEERGALTLTEICYRVRMPKTTVYRYLQTLCLLGFVSHDAEQDLYLLGHRLFELGQLAGEQLRIRDIALPHMQVLRDQFNETVNLGLLDGPDVVYVEMAESHHTLRMRATLGGRDPVYSTALGKAMLAFVPESRREQHIHDAFAARTPNTVKNRTELLARLARVRATGFAVDDGENEEGARCVGAPIFDYSGQVAAAISVSAPASRMDDEQLQQVAQAVMDTAATISRSLGYSPA